MRAARLSAAVIVTIGSLLATLPLPAQETPRLLVRAGSVDGPGALAPVFSVTMAPGGEILAAQPSVSVISVFDPAGRHLRNLGRSGGGPGEFRSLGALGWRGDTLWVMDPQGGRLHLYDRDLEFVRTVSPRFTDVPEGALGVVPGPLLADGSILGIVVTGPMHQSQPLNVFSQRGEPLRELTAVDLRGSQVTVELPGGARRDVTNPWTTAQLWTVAADGRSVIVASRPTPEGEVGRFGVVRIGLQGDTVFRREFTYAAVPLPRSEADSVHRRLVATLNQGPLAEVGEARLLAAVQRSVPAPDYYPPARELVAGDDGSLWFRRHLPVAATAQWEVFDSAGSRLRTVMLPADFQVHGADAARVWGVRTAELDIPFVEVYGLQEVER